MPDDSDAPLTRSERRVARERRRRLRYRVFVGALTVVTVVLVGLVTTDTLRLPGGPSPRLADASVDAGEAVVGDAPDVEDATRPLSVEDPLRLWVGGDSLAGALGPALGEYASGSGVVRTWYDSHTSSGLVDQTIIDWPEEASQQMTEVNPEAVVFIMGANDHSVVDDAGDWRDDYAARTGEMMDILTGSEGRPVYWIGSPAIGDDEMSSRVAQVNEVFVEQAGERPTVAYVNAYDLFSPNGVYSQAFENREGEVVTMRDGDGVHFTGEGARYLAGFVWDLLDAAFEISTYAVPGETQPVEESGTPSRFENPGSGATTSTGSTGSSATQSAPVATSPPVTEPAPVATSPPAPTEPVVEPTSPPVESTQPTSPPGGGGGGESGSGGTGGGGSAQGGGP